MNQTRTYTMRARAAAVEETRRRILQAAFELATERLISEISLEMVADAAGVSVQTVIRQFGNRAGLLQATGEHGRALVAAERRAPAGDVATALRVLNDHYEQRGDATIILLAQESTDPAIQDLTERGRAVHRAWVEEVFAPLVTAPDPQIDLLVVATDVYTWKLLRRDRALSRAETEARMATLVSAVLSTAGGRDR